MKYIFFTFLLFVVTISFSIKVDANPFMGKKGESSPATAPVISVPSGSFSKIQFKYRDKISELLREMKTMNSGKLVFGLIVFSFLYGLFHAIGPGHRKIIIFSLFLSRNSLS